MSIECLPAITRCFSGKTLKITSKRFNLKPDNSSRSPSSLSNSSSGGSAVGSASSRTITHALTPRKSREEELREVFRYFDVDGDGKISGDELRVYFGSVGEHISYEDAEGVIGELDSDGDGMLDFKDFLRMMAENNKGKNLVDGCNQGDDDDDLKKVFEMFEHERGSGRITPRGLQRMLGRLGDSKSHDECAVMIQTYDIDGDGEIDFHEFHQMMMS